MRDWVDIHCHLLPGVDDGAKSDAEALAMARLAVVEGTSMVICTPHQLGNYRHNRGDDIRGRVTALQELLTAQQVPLAVLPGADVRIEHDLPKLLQSGEVLTLGDHGKHVLLELPHELYFPLEPLLAELHRGGMVGILSHPERNRGIQRQPSLIPPLVDAGCLMQVTAGSLTGSFGREAQRLAELLLTRGWVHFLATDAHGPRSRRPLLQDAFARATKLCGERAAVALCRDHPRQVAEGRDVPLGVQPVEPPRAGWRFWKRAA